MINFYYFVSFSIITMAVLFCEGWHNDTYTTSNTKTFRHLSQLGKDALTDRQSPDSAGPYRLTAVCGNDTLRRNVDLVEITIDSVLRLRDNYEVRGKDVNNKDIKVIWPKYYGRPELTEGKKYILPSVEIINSRTHLPDGPIDVCFLPYYLYDFVIIDSDTVKLKPFRNSNAGENPKDLYYYINAPTP